MKTIKSTVNKFKSKKDYIMKVLKYEFSIIEEDESPKLITEILWPSIINAYISSVATIRS